MLCPGASNLVAVSLADRFECWKLQIFLPYFRFLFADKSKAVLHKQLQFLLSKQTICKPVALSLDLILFRIVLTVCVINTIYHSPELSAFRFTEFRRDPSTDMNYANYRRELGYPLCCTIVHFALFSSKRMRCSHQRAQDAYCAVKCVGQVMDRVSSVHVDGVFFCTITSISIF